MANVLEKDNSLLLIIDEQEKLVTALDKDIAIKNTTILAKAAKILGIPAIVTQQYPKGLGETITELKGILPENTKYFDKTSFSAVKESGFLELIKSYGKTQIVICGIETHICVHQTTADLLDAGFEVYVAKDACASRAKYEFKQGIERMQENGAKITCVEIALFEGLKSSKAEHLKEIQDLII